MTKIEARKEILRKAMKRNFCDDCGTELINLAAKRCNYCQEKVYPSTKKAIPMSDDILRQLLEKVDQRLHLIEEISLSTQEAIQTLDKKVDKLLLFESLEDVKLTIDCLPDCIYNPSSTLATHSPGCEIHQRDMLIGRLEYEVRILSGKLSNLEKSGVKDSRIIQSAEIDRLTLENKRLKEENAKFKLSQAFFENRRKERG